MSNPICPAWRQGKGIGKFNGREEFSEFNLPHELKLLIADDEFCQAAIGRLAGVAVRQDLSLEKLRAPACRRHPPRTGAHTALREGIHQGNAAGVHTHKKAPHRCGAF